MKKSHAPLTSVSANRCTSDSIKRFISDLENSLVIWPTWSSVLLTYIFTSDSASRFTRDSVGMFTNDLVIIFTNGSADMFTSELKK